MKRRTVSAGFSLIEMIVALAIFSALMSILLFGFRQGLDLWDRATQSGAYWQSLEARHDMLRRLFFQAQIAQFDFGDERYRPFFSGDADHLRFISAAPVLDALGSVRPVSLRFRAESDGFYSLLYSQGPRGQDPERGLVWTDQEEFVLLEGLRDPAFRMEAPPFPLPYELGRDQLSEREQQIFRDDAEWISTYETDRLLVFPRRIEVRFTDRQGIAHVWRFVVANEPDAWSSEI